MSYRNKFIIMIVVWSFIVLGFGFLARPWILNNQNKLTAASIQSRKHLLEQQAEQENYKKAEASMNTLLGKPVRPDDLLPNESTLVTELALMENWAEQLSLDLKTRLNGSVSSSKKADTKVDIALVPLSISLKGSTKDTLIFLSFLEESHLPFVVDKATISADGTSKDGGVLASLDGNVYIKR